MAKKKKAPASPPSSSFIRPAEARAAILHYYYALHLEWILALQGRETDWEHLLYLHESILGLEQQAPWLRTEALDAAL